MQRMFAYYNTTLSEWVGGFDDPLTAVEAAASRGITTNTDSLISVIIPGSSARTPSPRRTPAAAPAGSWAAFQALGQ